jgi:hypothetical protein
MTLSGNQRSSRSFTIDPGFDDACHSSRVVARQLARIL